MDVRSRPLLNGWPFLTSWSISMKRTLLALALASLIGSVASAQTITPGIGGVAVTGNSGAGVYLPYTGGGAVIGSPGIGSYNLSSGGYVSPYSWSNYSNPTAYNFNTGSFNYNSGLYTSGYTPWASGNTIIQSGYTYPSSSSYYYPASSGYYSPSSYYSTYPSSSVRVNGRGRVRYR